MRSVEHEHLVKTTQEVLRRRVLTKEAGNDFRNTFADVSLLDRYGRAPTLDDLKQGNSRALAFITNDDEGRTVRTVPGVRPPYRVYARWLDADAYVFVHRPNLKSLHVLGWLPAEQVEQTEIQWFEKDEKRVDYCHEVQLPHLIKMPDEFNFVEACDHSRKVWDYTYEAWECFICGRIVLDEKEIGWYQRYCERRDSDQLQAASETVVG